MSRYEKNSTTDTAQPSRLDRVAVLQRMCLGAVGLISVLILVAWLAPPLSRVLPAGWSLMKYNTALSAWLGAAGLASFLAQRRNLSRALAALVLLLALASLAEYGTGVSLHIGRFSLDTLFAADANSPYPGRMAPQSALAFTLLATATLLLGATGRRAARVADALIFLLLIDVLFIVSGNVFGAMHLFGLSMESRTSPQTLLALFLLTCVIFTCRTGNGVFSILFGDGIGSRIARFSSPFALFLPLLLEVVRGAVIRAGLLGPAYATAVVASTAAILAFTLILVLAWRIDRLQREISDLSLRDDLTGLYNRRGFYLLANQARRLAQRIGTPYSVLFIDLDNLKQINDRYGHEVGSDCLRELARLLRQNFRETDVIGRVGGDEFLVAGEWDLPGAIQLVERLEMAAVQSLLNPDRPCPLSFSSGNATAGGDSTESLDSMIGRADNAMYACKRQRKLATA